MYRLMSDAANLMRLRLRPAEEYTYPLLDCLGALVMVAAVNTAMLSPVLNGQYGMIAFVLSLNLVKWPVFAGVMTRLMGALGGRRQSLWGYTLLTEVLSLPALLILYVPSLALLLQVWMAWAFAVGVMGCPPLRRAPVAGVAGLYCQFLRPGGNGHGDYGIVCCSRHHQSNAAGAEYAALAADNHTAAAKINRCWSIEKGYLKISGSFLLGADAA